MQHVFAPWLAAGWLTRTALLKSSGKDWFELQFLPSSIP
jgi:ACR3 family arsenite efflux pump ArsB